MAWACPPARRGKILQLGASAASASPGVGASAAPGVGVSVSAASASPGVGASAASAAPGVGVSVSAASAAPGVGASAAPGVGASAASAFPRAMLLPGVSVRRCGSVCQSRTGAGLQGAHVTPGGRYFFHRLSPALKAPKQLHLLFIHKTCCQTS
ncbi:mRNA decay activator protein ZFP36L3-like [Heterodontus francisci]|uniref:mRNA decay activator protein ZFP36L3-like n=1 Tax=Heterodontus francisci TaxID=7792 RepID=UPI00355B6031